MFYFDPFTMILAGLCAAIASGAAALVKSRISAMHQVPNRSGLTGREAALKILQANGIMDVKVEASQGWLSDHYSPRERIVRLSPEIHDGRSVSALAVAAHEVGHAIQHYKGYPPLALRSAAVPVANFGPMVAMYVFIPLGIFLQSMGLIQIGLILFASVFLFATITLPVEFNASSRALAQIDKLQLASPDERAKAKKVLTAAALTYVAASITALIWLVFMAWKFGLLGNRR